MTVKIRSRRRRPHGRARLGPSIWFIARVGHVFRASICGRFKANALLLSPGRRLQAERIIVDSAYYYYSCSTC